MKQKTGRKLLSFLLTLAMLVGLFPGMSLTAYAAGEDITSNITISVSLVCEDEDCTVSSDEKDEYTVKEGVVVTFKCSKYFADAVTIYLNGTAVATWPGSNYNSKYVWTAKKDAKINWAGYRQKSANIYLTETSTVAVTGITLAPTTATLTVGDVKRVEATVLPANATNKTVKWSTTGGVTLYSDENCTAGNEIGADATSTLTVYAKGTAAGSATVTATSNADSTKTASCAVTVTDPLADAKTSAKADLDTLQSGKNQNDYDEADWTTLTQAITDGKTAIDNATTTEAITTAKNNAVDAVNAVKTKAQKELDNAKTSAVNTVNAVNANDYIAADQQTVTDAKTTALAAIEAATAEEEVTTALNNFNNAIAGCTTQAAADLADAKTTATETVNGVDADDYIAADQQTVTNAKTTALNAIEAATTVDAVNTAITNFNTAIANCTTQAAADLADAKTTATATVNAVNANDYIAADQQTVTNAKTTALNAISSATTEAEVTTALNTFNTTIAACTTQAAADLADAKTTATETVNGVDANDYIEADRQTVANAKATALNAINTATTEAEVTTALTNFNTAIAACTTQAAQDLADAKTTATNTVNGVNAADYITADQDTVTNAKTTALNAINTATTEDEVTAAMTTFNNAIAGCTTQAAADVITQVMNEVSAKTGSDVVYSGNPIQLINTPTTSLPNGYTMKYAVTTENTAPADNLYTTSIPTATDAGTYYVWYKVVGDDNHSDSEPVCVEATISERPVYESEPSSLTVTSEIGTITRVTVDGKAVDSKYYFVSGSSVVLSDEFMRSLSNGTHTIRLYDGVTYATATWTVTGNATPTITAPKTGDPGVVLYGLLAVSSTLGLAWMGRKRKAN